MNKKIFPTITMFLLGCLFCCTIIGCGNKSKNTAKVKVNYYIYEPSTQLDENGKPDLLYVNFEGSAAKLEDVNKQPSAPISITPNIAGTWKWNSDTELVFYPNETWKLSTKYQVNMPQSIFASHASIKSDFSFTTDSFSASISDEEFYINPENPTEKRVTCTVYASHPINRENIEKSISLSFVYLDKNQKVSKTSDCKYQYTWNNTSTELYIVSEALPIPPYSSYVEISLSKGLEAQIGGKTTSSDSTRVTIPGMNDFVKITNTSANLVKNNQQNYDQVITIETKGSISVDEIFKHMKLYLLPKDRPAMEGWDSQKNFRWTTDYVTNQILELSEIVPFESIPTAEPATSLNSFKFSAPEGRRLYLAIEGELSFFGGYKLKSENSEALYDAVLYVPDYPRELAILSEGTILSLSGSKKMAMYSRGVDKVYYRLSRIMPKDVNHLVSMSNGDMKNFNFSNYNFNENNIAESETFNYKIPDYSESELSYFSFDFTQKLQTNAAKNLKNGLFLFQVTNKESSLGARYPNGLSDRRLILITDLGFFVKQNADNSRDIFVQSISTGRPVPYAQVEVIGLNGNTIVSTTTDISGHAKLPDLPSKTYFGEHKPTAYVVKTAADLSFMPYSATGQILDYSNFPVGGEYGLSDPKKISAYLFNDRGMYRPGETAHLGIIAKAGDWSINLKGTPVEIEIRDPNGSVAFTKRLQLSNSAFEEVDFSTQEYSPTGYYNVTLYLIKEYKNHTERQHLASDSFKVEEFLPDTLNLSTSFDPLPNNGWINPDKLSGTLTLKNLFGTPAAGNEIKAQMTLTAGTPPMYKYPDYKFYDPFYKGKSFDEFLGTTQTDENGSAIFDLDLSKFEKATYRLQFYAEAFEKGSGRSVSNQASVYVSPLKYLIGYKADGKLDYINKDSKRKLTFIAINQNLEQIDLDDVTLNIEDIRYISTLVKQSNGLYKYQSVKKTYPISSEKIKISKEGTEFFLPSENAGEYKISLINSDGLVFNSVEYSIIGDKNISRSLTQTAELDIKLENTDLTPGQTAQIFIKAPYAGSGLITVERDHVYTWKWFTTTELSTVQTIQIPNDLEGNGYINVMFTRAQNSEEIFMSPFCYGAVPFTVDKSNRTNKIKLDIPTEVKSGTDLEIKYSSSDEGKIVIFAIDEGILQVAHYRTPDPISYFFKKRALEVRTSQIMDLILPEYNILRTLSATGGGANMEMLAKNLNPFKRKQNAPVAFWSGLLETGKETRSVTYHIPDYFNGSVKVMAVAVSSSKIGTAETSLLARNTMIISPNVPLAAAPGDEFDVSVTVTNNHKGSGTPDITLTAETSEHLEISGNKSVTMKIPEGKDGTASFKVKAKDVLGGAEIKFTAADNTESSSLTSTISVRPSMPYQIWIESGVSKNGKAETNVNHQLYEEYAQRDVAASNVPTAFIDGLDFYLAKYPYGCAEQITSKAYPYLYEDFVKAGKKTHADAEKMVNDTISIIQSRLRGDGQVGYWTSKSKAYPYITVYCAEFLTDARNNGFYVPQNLYDRILEAVKSIAADNEDDEHSIYERAYAIYVLTKSEIVTTSYIEKLENDITRKNFNPTSYEGLYLAASYAMLKQDSKANAILSKVKAKKVFDSSWPLHNDLHYIATYIDVIASYFPSRIKDISSAEIDELCNCLNSVYYNTYSTSAAIRAFENYSHIDKSESYKAYEIHDKTQTEIPLIGDITLKGKFSPDAQKVLFTNDKTTPLYYQTTQAGFEKNLPTADVKNGIEVSREYTTADGGKLTSIKVGDTITVKVNFRSLKGVQSNIAIIDMLPAGFESDIVSIRQFDDSKWAPEYVDIREDRTVIYGTVNEKINTFTYQVKAVSSGTFVVPPLFAESMYNKEIRAYSINSPITISPINK